MLIDQTISMLDEMLISNNDLPQYMTEQQLQCIIKELE